MHLKYIKVYTRKHIRYMRHYMYIHMLDYLRGEIWIVHMNVA
jgi:hypothetical protein